MHQPVHEAKANNIVSHRERMKHIDVLVPGIMGLVMGLLLVTVPRLFTRAEGDEFEKIRRRLKSVGFVLMGVLISVEAILYLVWQM